MIVSTNHGPLKLHEGGIDCRAVILGGIVLNSFQTHLFVKIKMTLLGLIYWHLLNISSIAQVWFKCGHVNVLTAATQS